MDFKDGEGGGEWNEYFDLCVVTSTLNKPIIIVDNVLYVYGSIALQK